VLRRLQDLRQALAFGIDLLGECSQDIGTLDGVLRGLDVVGADSFDDLVVAAVALLLGGAGGAEEAVGGAFGLVLGAACRTDNSGAVGLVTSPSRDVRSEVGGLVGKVPLLDDARYILRKLSNTRSSKLEDNPASRQVLLLGVVRYPLNLAPVSIGDARHVGRVRVLCNSRK
jgi:hypothetical protein